MSKKYQSKKAAHKTTRVPVTCAKDMIGFLAGVEWGSVAGPWGMACGGLTAGLWASYGFLVTNPGTVSDPTATVVLSGRNPYEFIGQVHNSGLTSSLNDFGILNGTTNTMATYYDFEREYIKTNVPQFNGASIAYNDFALLTQHMDAYEQVNGQNPMPMIDAQLQNSVVSQSFHDFWVLNYNTLDGMEDPQDVANYYSELVDIIVAAEDLTQADKELILQCASFNAYADYWHLVNHI